MLNIIFLSLSFSFALFATIIALTNPELSLKYAGFATFFAFVFMFLFSNLSFRRGAKVEGGSASGRASGKTKGG